MYVLWGNTSTHDKIHPTTTTKNKTSWLHKHIFIANRCTFSLQHQLLHTFHCSALSSAPYKRLIISRNIKNIIKIRSFPWYTVQTAVNQEMTFLSITLKQTTGKPFILRIFLPGANLSLSFSLFY